MAETSGSGYTARLTELEYAIVGIMRSFESIQENLKLGEVKESQARMVQDVGDTFRRFDDQFVPLEPPIDKKDLHARVCAAVTELSRAYNLFMSPPNQQWTVAFLYSRRSFCRGLYALYELRDQLPVVNAHFLMPGARAAKAGESSTGGAATGFIQHKRTPEHGEYTLFVPDDYSAAKQWPLIVCLHGGYGEGFEYIWTWLRPGRSNGCILLAPKSLGVTWEMNMQSVDTHSVLAMLREVGQQYSIDQSRVYLTGLSDGGIFTYILGLEHPELFAGLAPVAGALHLGVDPMLREGRGKNLPLFVIHGVHDFIFPVTFTRQTCKLLTDLGYNVRYDELPDWGHAFPYSINENLVLPWFQSLPPKPVA
ncbi:MAG: prolyl oligopeptidase family serine peptidase [Candidatus Binataceae bacterium]|jgi:phospholipase/carboxylesterase